MAIYAKFQKLNINLSSVGFEQSDCNVRYFCTPKGANIIGWAGLDGIHYCFIRGFDEMVFAVSPENLPGDYVHPIARNFEDLLRLIIACGGMAAIEQAHAWDRSIFNSFLNENKPTAEKATVLEELSDKLLLSPIDDPFAYIKELQAKFDYSKIKFTADYYDVETNADAPIESTKWQVFYDGGYWSNKGKGRAGEEIKLNSHFAWGDELWHIPAIYSCGRGFVIDYCVEIQPEKVQAFINKWELTRLREDKLTGEQREQLENDNPLNVKFRAILTLNGKEIHPRHGTGMSWIPETYLPEGVKNKRETMRLMEHYGLDVTRAWSFHRWSCPWTTQRKPTIKSLTLKLERNPTSILGVHFKNPSAGDVITFIHPTSGIEHKLTVQGYEKQELSTKAFAYDEYEFPTHHTAMTYTVEPDLSEENFQVRDCLENEEPKRKPRKPFDPHPSYDACSIGIIGGADGPTALIFSRGDKTKTHAALSALHFAPVDEVEWKIVFREKLSEDVEIALISEMRL